MVTIRSLVLFGSLCLVSGNPQAWAERPGFYRGDMPIGGPGRGSDAPAPHHRGHHAPCPPHGVAAWNTFWSVGWPWVGGATWINPLVAPGWNFGAFWPKGVYFNPATNTAEYYLPPTIAPAELSYGPLAVERFLGVRRDLWPTAPPGASAVEAALDAQAVADRLRRSNESTRARGQRFLEAGDALFLQQRFHEALQRYKAAIVAAPDLADAYTRQGCALIAVRQYRLATKAFRIALELDAAALVSRLHLDDLYGANRLAKSSHLDEVARAALAAPDDGDLLFLVGVMLHANGETDRAVRFFEKAAELGGAPAARLLAPLLPAAAKATAAPAAEWDT